MKLVESQFGKNNTSVESLTARNQVPGKEIESQKSKIETLKSAPENARRYCTDANCRADPKPSREILMAIMHH